MYKINTTKKTILADTITPVSIYLRIRDLYPNSILLESSDYRSRENAMSYICCHPYAGIQLTENRISSYLPDGSSSSEELSDIRAALQEFKDKFELENTDDKILNNGMFGYFTWNMIPHFENIELSKKGDEETIPPLQYNLYSYVIAVDHFKNQITLIHNSYGESDPKALEELEYLIQNKKFHTHKFSLANGEEQSVSEEGFKELVLTLKKHIQRGDVFQIVPSIAFKQKFKGDEFNVYRSLRSINPSPYLFYFDYGNFKLFGSSPEAQITVKDREASIYPIAGTFKRTGNDAEDLIAAKALENDPKESSEHVMLVDLARNDLSKHCNQVKVKSFKEIQFYSHLIHLVSKISGTLREDSYVFDVVADTYPAGTLSGAPKYRAIELLDAYEHRNRNFYGGAIGFMGFNDEFVHAIMIRTFLSAQNQLHYQAGAGIVLGSDPDLEYKEVNNKIAALRNAMVNATSI